MSIYLAWKLGNWDTFLRTGTLIYYMTFKLMILPKTMYKCTRLKIYTGHSCYYYYPYGSKGTHHLYVSWMLWGLSSFRAHFWTLTKWKVLGIAANASHRALWESNPTMITTGINQSAYSSWRVAIKNLNHCNSVMTRLKIDRSNKQKK